MRSRLVLAAAVLAAVPATASAAAVSAPQAVPESSADSVVAPDGSASLYGSSLDGLSVRSAAPGGAFGPLRPISLGAQARGLWAAGDGSAVAQIGLYTTRLVPIAPDGTRGPALALGGIAPDPAVDVAPDGSAVAVWTERKRLLVATKPAGGVFGAPQLLRRNDDTIARFEVAAGDGGSGVVVDETPLTTGKVAWVVRGGRAGAPRKLPEPTFSTDVAMASDGSGVVGAITIDRGGRSRLLGVRFGPAAPRVPALKTLSRQTRPEVSLVPYVPQAAVGTDGRPALAWKRGARLQLLEGPTLRSASLLGRAGDRLVLGAGRQAAAVRGAGDAGGPALTVTLRGADGQVAALRSADTADRATYPVTAVTRFAPDGSLLAAVDLTRGGGRLYRVTP